ncbi:MAG: gluconolactonase [Hyphomicrobiaceae bacterium]|jgi:gluconolactonase
MSVTAPLRTLASGLRFPEGPIAMPDGSCLVVEIEAGCLTRIEVNGDKRVIAQTGGGPNGAAIGADGRCYICNNGGIEFAQRDGQLFPLPASDDAGDGWIEAVDLDSGRIERLYTHCDGRALQAPNDIVFDREGGMWFTDHGKSRRDSRDLGAVYYARTDGSFIKQVVGHLNGPNGIGLSPDGSSLIVAETFTGHLWAFDITGPGEIGRSASRPAPWLRGRLIANPAGFHLFDSLAVERDGNVCVGSIPGAMLTVCATGEVVDSMTMPDLFPTNICFGGADLKTAIITLSGTGTLVAMDWPRAGLPLHFLNSV